MSAFLACRWLFGRLIGWLTKSGFYLTIPFTLLWSTKKFRLKKKREKIVNKLNSFFLLLYFHSEYSTSFKDPPRCIIVIIIPFQVCIASVYTISYKSIMHHAVYQHLLFLLWFENADRKFISNETIHIHIHFVVVRRCS